ncbi:MAG TPA: HD domain-containing protein [Nitrospirota bacterium]|nr:HD domain-containing protein [Nitrospirota bacterium]
MEQRDLERLTAWFTDYCRSFTADAGADPRPYAVKEEHTGNVCGNILQIAGSLSLDNARTAIAEIVALFHDVGRFPQYQRYGTFRDGISVNHAALGAKVLLEERVLAGLPDREQRVITDAITLHNVLTLPDGLDDEVLLYTKLIRDADKLDIWRVFVEYYRTPLSGRSGVIVLDLPETPGYNPALLDCLVRGEIASHKMVKSQNDFTLLRLSWVYDLNFPGSFRILSERESIGALVETLQEDDKILAAVDHVQEFVERKRG